MMKTRKEVVREGKMNKKNIKKFKLLAVCNDRTAIL